MKALAMRIDAPESRDQKDLEALIGMAGYTSIEQGLAVVERYYPRNRILPRTEYGIADILERLAEARDNGS